MIFSDVIMTIFPVNARSVSMVDIADKAQMLQDDKWRKNQCVLDDNTVGFF